MPMTPAAWVRTTSLIEYEKPTFDEAIKNTWDYPAVFGDQRKLSAGDGIAVFPRAGRAVARG